MMTPSTWLIAAAIALIAEFMSGSFYLLMLALALAGGGLTALFLPNASWQYLVAALTGLVGVSLLYRHKQRTPAQHTPTDPDINQTVRVLQQTGLQQYRVHYRGTEWDARLAQGELKPDDQAHIIGHNGNTLLISPNPDK